MRNIMRKTIVVIAVAMVVALCASFTAVAQNTNTISRSIELTTRSALLVDRSGSIKDQDEVNNLMDSLDLDGYDFVGYFDDKQISVDPDYAGGGDSFICETIDQMAVRGFTHITVITDGEQWPQDYSSLAAYTDLDVTIYLVGNKSAEADKLVDELSHRMVNSSLTVKNPDGADEVILSDYQPPVYSIDFDIPESENTEENNNSTTVINNDGDGDCHCKCLWWLALILALLGAAIFDTIHELITRGRREEAPDREDDPTSTPPTPPVIPIPPQAVVGIAKGSKVLADFSGSMAAQQSATAEACRSAGAKSILCFGNTVEEVQPEEIDSIQAGGQTPGWEALEEAAAKGWCDITIVSDLGFNGKPFEKKNFPKKFRRIAVVVPSGYDRAVLKNLQEIADEVEVIPLQ